MVKGIFERRFGVDPKTLSSIKEVDDIVEKQIGRKLEIRYRNALPIVNISADEMIDSALAKR